MFAHALGLKLTAAQGDIVIHAHLGNIQIKSAGRISLVSAERIELEAPTVRVLSQGAQTDWGNGVITQQSSGEQVHKAAGIVQMGPGAPAPKGVAFPASHLRTDEYAVLTDEQTGLPVPNQRYRATLENGRVVTGCTDEHGRTSLLRGDVIGEIAMQYLVDDQPSR
jgi:type VI secretion system secreted protein VgrG